MRNRWIQLLFGLVCMITISSPQYVWALFTQPLTTALGVSLAELQVTFSLLIVVQTFLSPPQGFLVDKFGPRVLLSIGALLTGVFAQAVFNPIFGDGKPTGGLDGRWVQVGYQLAGVLFAWVFALVGTIVILKIVDMVTGVRVTEEQELEGLDISQHGEEAYNTES